MIRFLGPPPSKSVENKRTFEELPLLNLLSRGSCLVGGSSNRCENSAAFFELRTVPSAPIEQTTPFNLWIVFGPTPSSRFKKNGFSKKNSSSGTLLFNTMLYLVRPHQTGMSTKSNFWNNYTPFFRSPHQTGANTTLLKRITAFLDRWNI